ncbi:MAG: GDSL-type esterase/lipase family protein [bacterium]|nr:GDSL-type esterase/lipase family protein [bacterium]
MNRMLVHGIAATAAALFIGGCAGPQKALFRETAAKTHKSVTPAPSTFEWAVSWWQPRHEAVNARLRQGGADLLLIGDSITHGFDNTGRKVWDLYYAPRNAVNMGFGGDWTQHVLWRLDHSDFSAVRPKLAVVLIGTNNSNRDDCTAREIADGVIAVCGRLRSALPDTKILLLAILPRDLEPTPQRMKITEANRLASRVADGKTIVFEDYSGLFLNPDGTLKKELMPDCLHPNAEGYRVWTEAMEPVVARLMGEKK